MPHAVSENARHAVDHLFVQAAKANLVMDTADVIEIEHLPGGGIVETPETNIFVLTISSYLFRLLTVFHVDPEGAAATYFSKGDSERSFIEVFGEVGNLCCGAMNRELGKHFLHTGMSTPNMLGRRCVTYLNELKPDHVSRYSIRINDSVAMHATLCLCAYAPINFRVDTAAAVEETGALELF
jgi:hypothetical protein